MPAVIWIQRGPTAEIKQETACHEHVQASGYHLAAIVSAKHGDARDVVAMVARGEADVVVVAFGGRDLAADVIAAGGRVEAVHPTPHIVEPPVPPPAEEPRTVGGLLARLRRRGKTVAQIAAFLDSTTGEVRDLLRRGE